MGTLTKLTVRGFKRFDEVEIELGDPVVFIGPNNSGKTTALQALSLWNIGVRRWLEKRKGRAAPEKRPGVTINRRDLIAIPIPDANHLWRDLHVRDVTNVNGRTQTQNVRIDVIVEGTAGDHKWTCGLEFDYANAESFYCRPLRTGDQKDAGRMPVPDEAGHVQLAYLPPMSGLAATETLQTRGAINSFLGQGRTAEVLRNLCYLTITADRGGARWKQVVSRIEALFGVTLDDPVFVKESGEVLMSYREGKTQLELSSAGRGLQQTLLLLTHMEVNPGAVLLLDEPDAHLEFLRQRQTYNLLTDVARETGSQIIAASHSEVVLNEAADRDVVIAFVGKPHRIDDRGSQLLKALKSIGFEDFVQAEQTGWVLYLEGSTDLAVLRALATVLKHAAWKLLERPFVKYVNNQPKITLEHFYGLREAKKDLIGLAIYDRLGDKVEHKDSLRQLEWGRREIENYVVSRASLVAWSAGAAELEAGGPIFVQAWQEAMDAAIQEVETALKTLGKDPWSPDIKVSDDFLKPLFENFYKRVGLPNLMWKSDYHWLARYMPPGDIADDVKNVLDEVVECAAKAKPREG